MKDCTTCKYGYEDEQLGFPMCHHPERFSEDCIDFNMHEEKEIKESEKPVQNDLEEAAGKYADETYYAYPPEFLDFAKEEIRDAYITGAKWQKEQMMKEAVEADVFGENYGSHRKVISEWLEQEIGNPGDKVRVIIVKEDEK